jgi:ABC-type uncharacterized transport system involved in gliding motility auxiliary subunit
MKRIYKILLGILFLGMVFGSNYGVGLLPDLKLDLSANKINSLSNFTKKTINGVEGQIEAKVYVSESLPAEVKPIFNSLKTILKSMEAVNKSKFKLTFVDPLKDEQAKAEVQKYGIQPLQFSSIKSDKFEMQTGYFGMAIIYNGKSEVLPLSGDVGNLEYLLTSAISRMTSKSLPAIALADESGGAQYLQKFLDRSYKVTNVELDGDKSFPDEVSGLLIVGRSKKIDDKGITKIKKWIESGKPTLVFLDRVEVNQGMTATKNEETGLEKILADYGIKIGNGIVTSKNGAMASFRTPNGNYLVRYPYWLQIPASQIEGTNPVLSGMSMLLMPWVSPLELSGEAKQLFWSDSSGQVDDSLTDISPGKIKESADGEKSYPLAAMRNDKIKLVVVGDKDFVSDQFVTNNQQNLALALNLTDYLLGDSGLFEIRNKSISSSPIRLVNDSIRHVIKYGNMAMPIVLLVIIYLSISWKRKRSLLDLN